MKAAYILNGAVEVGELPDPVPAKGHALVRTHSCGLCASEAHFLHAGQNVIDLSKQFGGPHAALDPSRPFVPGHEYVGEVIDYGPGSKRPIKPGRKVTSVPIMRQSGTHAVIGFSNDCPGGFGEYMVLDEDMLIEVPAGLDDDLAAMTEPLAVGLEHARRGNPVKENCAPVIGWGRLSWAGSARRSPRCRDRVLPTGRCGAIASAIYRNRHPCASSRRPLFAHNQRWIRRTREAIRTTA